MDNPDTSSPGDLPPPLPPPPAPQPARRPISSSIRQPILILLNLFFLLFLTDTLVSFVDDSLILIFDRHILTNLRGIVGTFDVLSAIAVYILMGITPLIPKRIFLPLSLFTPVSILLSVPGFVYFYRYTQVIAFAISLCQLITGLLLLWYLRYGNGRWWPMVRDQSLKAGQGSWIKFTGFLLLNVLVILPAVAAYLVVCTAFAVSHFSEGFVSLRPAGFTVQVRQYARNDGKSILLVPMSHVGEPEFYHNLSESFPHDSVILMEGVTDTDNLLTNRITYRRMATSLGLSQQERQFKPNPTQTVRADIDVNEFAHTTLDFLNLVMLLHSRGLTLPNVLMVMQCPQPPGFERQLFDDLVNRRNRHLLGVIRDELTQANKLIVPWGAAHMPGIAREIQKAGFHVVTTQEYVAIRFGKK